MHDGPITECLKAAGRELHKRAEHGPFARELFKGRRPVEHYAAFLGQMWRVHAALEKAMEARRGDSPLIEQVLGCDTPKSPLIEEDLRSLGVDAAEPLEPTARFMDEIGRADDARLVGIHYVLEGSMNGNRFVAGALRKAYGFVDGEGTRYLDPYGEAQRATWAAYKTMLDGLDLAESQQEAIVEGDLATFRAVIAIHDALDEHFAAAVVG